MRGKSIVVGAVVALVLSSGVASANSGKTNMTNGHVTKCTPGVHKGKPFKSVIKGHAGLYRWNVVYPKNSGHEIIGGMCQANKKGLGRKKLVAIKLFPKVAKPKPTPPTTVVGNPPTVVVTPPAPPVVTPPAPPVAPPAPPAPTGSFSCDGFNPPVVNYLNANVQVKYTATGEYVFLGVKFAWDGIGSATTNGVNDAVPGLANGSHHYTQAGPHNVVAMLSFGRNEAVYTVTCSTLVTVTMPPPAVCRALGIIPPGAGSGDTLVNLHFSLPPGAVFVRATFAWGKNDGTDNSDAATLDPLTGLWESDDSHIYQFSDTYNITGTVTVDYSNGVGIPPTRVTSPITAACTGTVIVTGLPPTPPVEQPPPDIT